MNPSFTKLLVGIVAVALVAVGASFLTHSGSPVGDTPSEPVAGATAGVDNVDNPYTSFNGVRTYNGNKPLAATSSVVCDIPNPYGATSTVLNASLQINSNGIATAQTIDLSTSSTAVGSSSPALIKEHSIGASSKDSIVWLPAATTSTRLIGIDPFRGDSGIILGPTEHLTWRIASATPGVFTSYYTGICKANIRALN